MGSAVASAACSPFFTGVRHSGARQDIILLKTARILALKHSAVS